MKHDHEHEDIDKSTLQQPQNCWRFVPDTILSGYQWSPQWVPARTPTALWRYAVRPWVARNHLHATTPTRHDQGHRVTPWLHTSRVNLLRLQTSCPLAASFFCSCKMPVETRCRCHGNKDYFFATPPRTSVWNVRSRGSATSTFYFGRSATGSTSSTESEARLLPHTEVQAPIWIVTMKWLS